MQRYENGIGGPLTLEEALEALEPVANPECFRTLIVLNDTPEDRGLTVDEVATQVDQSVSQAEENVRRLTDAGLAQERMECLIDGDGEEQYEASEFGRLLLEQGVIEMLECADGMSSV